MRQEATFHLNNKRVFRWLMLGCVLIGIMLVVGGITRLTQSGLSMVKWEPIMGTIPPLNEGEWQEAFNLYKQSPEYHHYNSDFGLSDFKKIFFWEYIHRLLGRIIGLVFIIPCIYFWYKGAFNKRIKRSVLIIFCWGMFQGVLGWVMVKSGLKDVPHVSHLRLAAHFMTAVLLMMYIYWTSLEIKYTEIIYNKKLNRNLKVLIGLIVLQLIYGAFVAGLKAGLMYNTFPKMGTSWLPNELILYINREGLGSIVNSGGWVQFIHRWLPALILLYYGLIYLKSYKWRVTTIHRHALKLVGVILILQIVIGVLTVMYAVPVELGVMHQFGAVILLMTVTYTLFTTKKP